MAIQTFNQKAGSFGSSDGGFLSRKSELTKNRSSWQKPKNILIIDDNEAEAKIVRANLHLVFGYDDIHIRDARTIGLAMDMIMEEMPDLIFLDDILPPSETATDTLPLIKRCNYNGPIIIVSGLLNVERRLKLNEAGASHIIHKDNLDSVSLGEVLEKLQGAFGPNNSTP